MDQDFINNIKPEMLSAVKVVFLLIYAICIVTYSLYISNLYKLLSLVSPDNRRIQPAKVLLLAVSFLNIITVVPLFLDKNVALRYENVMKGIDIGITMFMLIFTFYMVNKISESLESELKDRGIRNDIKPTLSLGIFMCICNAGSLLTGIAYLELFGLIASVMGFVVWIMYWIKTKEYRLKLESVPRANRLNDLGIF